MAAARKVRPVGGQGGVEITRKRGNTENMSAGMSCDERLLTVSTANPFIGERFLLRLWTNDSIVREEDMHYIEEVYSWFSGISCTTEPGSRLRSVKKLDGETDCAPWTTPSCSSPAASRAISTPHPIPHRDHIQCASARSFGGCLPQAGSLVLAATNSKQARQADHQDSDDGGNIGTESDACT
ncbi:hypothetical protein FA95DRAFT_336196 [Auriscalpium vulgare]|uniref:Uncharacterized protein n=1 Tax=Auriscalpium vulgare TaxID=40419 RepID=A0ACB8RI53_9AGAM|nr:hypothetical protein FA95DRAFT_336196 [Auriscalpium vulgare]